MQNVGDSADRSEILGTWRTRDFLVELASAADGAGAHRQDFADEPVVSPSDAFLPLKTGFGAATLELLDATSDRRERLSVLRSSAFPERNLVVFAARTGSPWAMDALAGRLTRHAWDWQAMRAALVDFEQGLSACDLLNRVSLDRLYGVVEVLHGRNLDLEAERAMLRYIASRVQAGDEFADRYRIQLVERLINVGAASEARQILETTDQAGWTRHALATELDHPRFGGSFPAMLRRFNEPYRRLGFESIALDHPGETPFSRLSAASVERVSEGPLVSVIMTCREPGAELLASASSIVSQTYQNWELIVMDDGSADHFEEIFRSVESLDQRVRVIRCAGNVGTYVRRNEAMRIARGQFVAIQGPGDWSHPRRLELQVRDLLDNPDHLANTVSAVRVTEDFSLVSRRGAGVSVCESSIVFRKDATIAAVGFFDSVRKCADAEFRRRIETVTGPVPTLLPSLPLALVLPSPDGEADCSAEQETWNDPDELAYRSAAHHFERRVREGKASPYVEFPVQSPRPFAAPPAWLPNPTTVEKLDLLVVLDARAAKGRAGFVASVTRELKTAAQAGLRVGVIQLDAVSGPTNGRSYWPADLQALVDDGSVVRVGKDAPLHVRTLVIRHAAVAQAHPRTRWPLHADHVYVVVDSEAGDARGKTYARGDVTDIVGTWFGRAPKWISSPAVPPLVDVRALIVEEGSIVVGVQAPRATTVTAGRLLQGDVAVPLTLVGDAGDTQSTWRTSDGLRGGQFEIEFSVATGARRAVWTAGRFTETTTIVDRTDRIVAVRPSGVVFVEPAAGTTGDAVEEDVNAVVHEARIVDGRLEITVAGHGAERLMSVYASRVVPGEARVRRRDFARKVTAEGKVVWRRTLDRFAGIRWELLGVFQTAAGLTTRQLSLEGVRARGGDGWAVHCGPVSLRVSPVEKDAGAFSVVKRRLGGLVRRDSSGVQSHREEPSPAAVDTSIPRVAGQPMVSVVMPVYNVEPYLERAIRSVLDQSWSDLELIVVDDASTDGSRDIAARLWRDDPRIRVINLDHNTLGGAGIPSNVGIDAARGRYVAFADSDDFVTASGLAELVRAAEAANADLAIGDFVTFADGEDEAVTSYDRQVWNRLPIGPVTSAVEHPALFRLSPVPWRKLYRREFLEVHGIRYPEGDFFYEDNPLHWFVLARAERVVMVDEVISWHRREREGQTMSAQTYRLGAFTLHMQSMLDDILKAPVARRTLLIEQFYDYLSRTSWIINRQTQPAAAALVRRAMGDVVLRAQMSAPDVPVPEAARERLTGYRLGYPNIDLTVVIPVYNSADTVRQAVRSVLETPGVRVNILLVDDGSSDDSLTVLRGLEAKHPNVHVFTQGNRGAGRARNSVIPLCTGRYTLFLDADDSVRPQNLAKVVAAADTLTADLVFMKYRIDYVDEGRSRGIFNADKRAWSALKDAKDQSAKQGAAARLINYPWNRIIRTSLLREERIFFGSTPVHNDVLFHWHSIVASRKIHAVDVEVCVHRKFTKREQVTNIADARRLAVLAALIETDDRIAPLRASRHVREAWIAFARHILGWAEGRVPADHLEEYRQRRAILELRLESAVEGNRMRGSLSGRN